MHYILRIFGIFGAMLVVGLFVILASDFAGYNLSNFLLSSVFPVTITPEKLHETYKTSKIKILVVPGHDNKYTGSEFLGTREADLTLAVARNLVEYLKKDSRLEVFTTRDFSTGEYTSEFASFFNAKAQEIREFRAGVKKTMNEMVALGRVTRNVAVERKDTLDGISFRLFGINKWANDHGIDIALHLHFNDDSTHRRTKPGKYSGFSIYTPEKQYGNSDASIDLAKSLFDQLATFFAPSNLPLEGGGIIGDQELIAVGSNASLKGVSVLIEYGYIYEPQFRAPETGDVLARELAYQTSRGIKNYFGAVSAIRPSTFETTLLPYRFTETLERGAQVSRAVLALQAALRREGVYPPPDKTIAECPVNGSFGPCTETAVTSFQKRALKGQVDENELGIVGRKTISELNRRYSL